jgi:molybdopterin-dependent oxidoreductase alpha subunit
MADKVSKDELGVDPYGGPSGGWGSLRGVASITLKERLTPEAIAQFHRMNKPEGVMCVSCAWGKPAKPHIEEFCENGAKATAWELTSFRTTPDFFRTHTVTELRGWKDHDLEQAGRLTHPMKYNATTDKYEVVPWSVAFADIGARLKGLDPTKVIFYASGRASLETSYMWQLYARMYGSQNLPDSSNMCHETTSVALKEATGSPVGTIQLQDYESCDAIFYFGQNPATNSPRFLHPLRDCAKRGVEIVVFNPLKERGLERFTDPQNPIEMTTGKSTPIATQYHQVRSGGDIAAIMGICKHVLELDVLARARGDKPVLDYDFIEQHTVRFEEFAAQVRDTSWDEIERESGLTRAALEDAGRVYAKSERVICVYGMGLTQHANGYVNLHMLVNLMWLRGNVGRPGAGFGPVRGHSNVQGQRTVGITEKPELAQLPRLKEMYEFEPPQDKGWDTVEAMGAVISGEAKAFIGLGGNLARAVPDRGLVEPKWQELPLTVSIATKLNRTHLLPGKTCYLLPCLGRIELDLQESGAQAVSMEDSFSTIHGSRGRVEPASPHLLSEPAIVAGMAMATLDDNPKVPWAQWVGDYARVRTEIENYKPEEFANFEQRMFKPGGFWRGNPAAHRKWMTNSGKAEFNTAPTLNAAGFDDADGRFRLITMRSNDQFNTTIYGYYDRFRSIRGTRDVVLMCKADMAAMGVEEGTKVSLVGDAGDGVDRRLDGLHLIEYDIPPGTVGAYYPEANVLMPLDHHDKESHTPAAKSVPVRVEIAA